MRCLSLLYAVRNRLVLTLAESFDLTILTYIIIGNLIAYPLKINCLIVKSRREYNVGSCAGVSSEQVYVYV